MSAFFHFCRFDPWLVHQPVFPRSWGDGFYHHVVLRKVRVKLTLSFTGLCSLDPGEMSTNGSVCSRRNAKDVLEPTSSQCDLSAPRRRQRPAENTYSCSDRSTAASDSQATCTDFRDSISCSMGSLYASLHPPSVKRSTVQTEQSRRIPAAVDCARLSLGSETWMYENELYSTRGFNSHGPHKTLDPSSSQTYDTKDQTNDTENQTCEQIANQKSDKTMNEPNASKVTSEVNAFVSRPVDQAESENTVPNKLKLCVTDSETIMTENRELYENVRPNRTQHLGQ